MEKQVVFNTNNDVRELSLEEMFAIAGGTTQDYPVGHRG